MMRVVVVGATGVLGRSVIPRLVERGHAVRAVVRRPEQARVLERLGVEATPGDILDPASLDHAVAGCDGVLHLASAVPRPGAAPRWDVNDRIRHEGTCHLLAAATRGGARRYVQQSIALVYGEQGTRVADEATPLAPGPVARSAADMEGLVGSSALDWRILRGGIFYGPGTGREDAWRAAARAGALRPPGDGSALVSLIHVADMARAVALRSTRGRPRPSTTSWMTSRWRGGSCTATSRRRRAAPSPRSADPSYCRRWAAATRASKRTSAGGRPIPRTGPGSSSRSPCGHAGGPWRGSADGRAMVGCGARQPCGPPTTIRIATKRLWTRYATLSARRSPDDQNLWLNWALRRRDTGSYVGTMQATVRADRTAMLAYMISVPSQGIVDPGNWTVKGGAYRW